MRKLMEEYGQERYDEGYKKGIKKVIKRGMLKEPIMKNGK